MASEGVNMSSSKHPFQALIVRYVHDVLLGEALNVGVVMVCSETRFAKAKFLSQWSRVSAAFPGVDLTLVRRIASALSDSCIAALQEPLLLGGVVAVAEQVLPKDEHAIGTSDVIYGATEDPNSTLESIFEDFVLRNTQAAPERIARQDDEVWQAFAGSLAKPEMLVHMSSHVLKSQHLEVAFEHAWKNGKWNIAQPLSFDLLEPRAIRDKAVMWAGRLLTARPSDQDAEVCFLVGLPGEGAGVDVKKAALDGCAILREELKGEARVFTEDARDELEKKIADDLAHAAH